MCRLKQVSPPQGARYPEPLARVSLTSNPAMKFCMVTTFYPPYNFGGDGLFIQRYVSFS